MIKRALTVFGYAVVTGLSTLLVLLLSVPVSAAAAPVSGDPPKLDVAAAIRALSTESIYRAPGAVATFDAQAVGTTLAPDVKLLVEPFTGPFGAGHNYSSEQQYDDQVYQPLIDWANAHNVKLVDVTGLYVRTVSLGGGAFLPSDLSEVRTLTAYRDVTSGVLGMINYLRTGATHGPSLPGAEVVAPTPAQLAPVVAALRANPVYNAPGREDPVELQSELIHQRFDTGVRVVAFPPLPPGQPLVDYAPALAAAFPGDDVFVSYGEWVDVAGQNQQVLESARNYAYGLYDNGTLQAGVDMSDRIGSILSRVDLLLRQHPFSRPQPAPLDLQHQISAIVVWVLVGSALLLGGGSLLSWQAGKTEARRLARRALHRESALASAAIAALGGRLLDAGPSGENSEAIALAAERHATANTLFDQAHTAEAMREVRTIAEEGEGALNR